MTKMNGSNVIKKLKKLYMKKRTCKDKVVCLSSNEIRKTTYDYSNHRFSSNTRSDIGYGCFPTGI
jgi:hypothetical protein